MTPQEIKDLISELIDLNEKISHYGGAEECPVLYQQYRVLRSDILKHFQLPEISVNFELFKISPETYTDKSGKGYILQSYNEALDFDKHLNSLLSELGINIMTEISLNDYKRQLHANRIYQRLSLRSKNVLAKGYVAPLEWLQYGRATLTHAHELLVLMGYMDGIYQRFLISIIWYNDYGSASEVIADLETAQEINNIWALDEFTSDLLYEKQLGTENLKHSGLKFIDDFIWWEQEFGIFSFDKSVNPNDK